MVSRPWLNPPVPSKNQLSDSMNPRERSFINSLISRLQTVLFAELFKALTSADRDRNGELLFSPSVCLCENGGLHCFAGNGAERVQLRQEKCLSRTGD